MEQTLGEKKENNCDNEEKKIKYIKACDAGQGKKHYAIISLFKNR